MMLGTVLIIAHSEGPDFCGAGATYVRGESLELIEQLVRPVRLQCPVRGLVLVLHLAHDHLDRVELAMLWMRDNPLGLHRDTHAPGMLNGIANLQMPDQFVGEHAPYFVVHINLR